MFCFVVVVVAAALWRQLRATLRAAALEYEAPGFRRHTGTETVGACTLNFAGLECAFHDSYLGKTRVSGPFFQKAGKGTQMPLQCQ